jgi:hypothetical protein
MNNAIMRPRARSTIVPAATPRQSTVLFADCHFTPPSATATLARRDDRSRTLVQRGQGRVMQSALPKLQFLAARAMLLRSFGFGQADRYFP